MLFGLIICVGLMHYQYKFVVIFIGLNFEALIKIVCFSLVLCLCLLGINLFLFVLVQY